MGGGEVARYLGKYGSEDVSKAVIISGVPPILLKTGDNPEGVDGSVFAGIEKAVAADRYAFFTEFFKNFYNTDIFLGKRVSEQAVQASWNVGASASATASLACVAAWHEDFRDDLARIDVPTLVIHGDDDRILPITASGLRTAKLIKGAHIVVVKDGPHCITWTHAEEVNAALVSFFGEFKRPVFAICRPSVRTQDKKPSSSQWGWTDTKVLWTLPRRVAHPIVVRVLPGKHLANNEVNRPRSGFSNWTTYPTVVQINELFAKSRANT
jgi:hypothetical protein